MGRLSAVLTPTSTASNAATPCHRATVFFSRHSAGTFEGCLRGTRGFLHRVQPPWFFQNPRPQLPPLRISAIRASRLHCLRKKARAIQRQERSQSRRLIGSPAFVDAGLPYSLLDVLPSGLVQSKGANAIRVMKKVAKHMIRSWASDLLVIRVRCEITHGSTALSNGEM